MKSSAKPTALSPSSRYALDAHHRAFAGSIAGAVAFVALQGRVSFPVQLTLVWCAFAFVTLVMAWIVICTKDPYQARRDAKLQDSSATVLFVLVISAATASLLAVGFLLGSGKDMPSGQLVWRIGLSVSAIFLSWALVHTIFALRYAHFFFWDAREVERKKVAGGLMFPGDHSPTFMDFAYFSFVIGMTCQVSDVQIPSPQMRRLALVHGLISFAFNTAILAMFVNIIAGLV